jgi:predicted DNA-binding transcriptional regulator AlpA
MLVDTQDLIDAQQVALMLGLSQRNSVSLYLHKYSDMPRPVIDLGPSRPRLWLRPDIETWLIRRGPVRRGRPRLSDSTGSENFHPPSGGVEVARGGRKPRAASRKRTASSSDTNTPA